jgi:hypothetical protein
MPRVTRTFSKPSGTNWMPAFESEAYTDDGKVWRWASNDAVVPPDSAREYQIPVDPAAQQAARDAEVAAVVERYKKARENHVPSAEEQFEVRAAFGPGADVVDVFTGQRFRT